MNKKVGKIFSRDAKDVIGNYIWTKFLEGIYQILYKAYYLALAEKRNIHLKEYYSPYDK